MRRRENDQSRPTTRTPFTLQAAVPHSQELRSAPLLLAVVVSLAPHLAHSEPPS